MYIRFLFTFLTVVFLDTSSLNGQSSDKKRYFDFHCHPSLKPFISDDRPDHKADCWRELEKGFPFGKKIIASQSALDQMRDGNVNLAVAAIAPITEIACFLPFLDFDWIRHRRVDKHNLLLGEIEHLRKSQDHDPASGRTLHIIDDMKEYDPDRLNVIIAIEGTHGLESEENRIPRAEILKSLKEAGPRILYLSIAYLKDNPTANHAYGPELVKKNPEFYPFGEGLTEKGKAIIDVALDEIIGGYKMYIDVKHMSYVARQDYYAYRREKYPDVPIIASHMGIAGIRADLISDYIDGRPRRNGGPDPS